jgi:sulfonate transport system permease protein
VQLKEFVEIARPRIQRRMPRGAVGVIVLLGLAGIWQLLSYAFPAGGTETGTGSPLVPGWGWIVTKAFPAIASYGGDGGGLSTIEGGSAGSYLGAISAIAQHSLATWSRVLLGTACGTLIGATLGVAISWSRTARVALALPAHVLKTLPLLAMIPLFQVWFGVSETGICLFVAYGVGIIFFSGTINAISNVPPIFTENARTLGASPAFIYWTVILPAIMPELRTSLILSTGVAWSAVVGAEFLGAQNGLGYVEVQAQQFALLDRMVVVALIFFLYASISVFAVERLSRRLVAWMPKTESSEPSE